MKIVILGSSAASISCADALRKNNKDVEITVVGKEEIMPYYRPQLSHMLCNDEVDKKFFLKEEAFYKEKNIRLILGNEAIEIDRDNKLVKLSSGEVLEYNKLVMGVGSNNFVPPLEGVELEGVCNLKFYEDLKNINTYIKDKNRVTIIGGGLLGIEAAWKFKECGKQVTLLEFADRLMVRQLNPAASAIVQKELQKEGINVFTQKSTKCIIGEGKVEKILLESGEEIPTDLLMFSIGIRPETKLAKESGLEVNRGIVVKKNMQTSDGDIYAAGDCAEVDGICLGIWPMAMQTGKIAAMDILNKSVELVMSPPTTILKALNIGVYSAGDISLKDEEIEQIDVENYRLFTFKENILTGVNLIGDTKLSSKVFSMLTKKMTKEQVLEIIK
ncbi:MAG: FAD-dependent oxidoreductase [Proteocatella sp.]